MVDSALRLLRTAGPVRSRIVRMYAFLIAFNVLAWALALVASISYPILLPTAFLAYTFGLRHAVDADHIAAIDNTTRKLMQDGERPVAVGLFFSLGHSTVVVALSVVIALFASVITDVPALQEIGSLIGTTVSAAFLLVIGLINLVVLIDIYRMFRRVARGGSYSEATLEEFLNERGLLARVFKPMLRAIRKSWHMYPLGILFGLGFDTASEVALLAISAGAASQGLPFTAVISLPLIFAAGMSLMDTTDGAFMAKAYSWAFSNPVRKLFYNMTMTGLSVFVALFVGTVELTQMLIQVLRLEGGIWTAIAAFDLGSLGFVIVASFIVAWIVAFAIFRLRRVEERWTALVESSS